MSAGHTELLPCPFCGGEATFETVGSVVLQSGCAWSAGCVNDECHGFQSASTYARKTEAAEAWNTRAIEAAEADLLGKALEALRMVGSIRPANWDDGDDDEVIASFKAVDAVLSQAREVK